MANGYESSGISYERTLHPVRETGRLSISRSLVRKFNRWKLSSGDNSVLSPHTEIKKRRGLHAFKLMFGWLRPFWLVFEEKVLVNLLTERIIEVSAQNKPDIIHAHTPYRVGQPALRAARRLGIPFVYEMRGMWEETAVANGRWRRNGPAYMRFRRKETKVLKSADAVICISQTLRDEAISRGVDPDRIVVVPNAVNPSKPPSDSPPLLKEARGRLSCEEGTVVVGYIGSLRSMEGVDDTVRAVASSIETGADMRFFALTTESGQAELRTLCAELGIAERSVVVGPVPHEVVGPFFELIDIFVISRPDTRVTRLVTPLKPFEAMMHGCAVLGANLPAIAEIIEDGVTGVLFKAGDIAALSKAIERLAMDGGLRRKLGEKAREWVLAERTWDAVIAEGLSAYEIAERNVGT
jgi:glycosyltransferase involved in cell wall biosynthesis